ncbi:MAG: hypothetical protein GY796_05135 [Chloroflexi bacterium]|nr:hypothetical protein [Chloroflexota bacterium]
MSTPTHYTLDTILQSLGYPDTLTAAKLTIALEHLQHHITELLLVLQKQLNLEP